MNIKDTMLVQIDTSLIETPDSLLVKSNDSLVSNKRRIAQVIDTTKTKPDSIIFGVKTTRFLYEDDLFYDTNIKRHPDTLLKNFHRYSFLQKTDYTYQNLGNFATAMQPIFYKHPSQIGTRWGMDAYRLLLFKPSNIQYFNTLSPYTKLYLTQGGQGKSHLDVVFNRNINAEWNVGAWYRRMSANKVIGNRFRKNDLQFTNQTIGLNMRFFTPNHRYKLLAYALYYQHDNTESGGLTSERDFKNLETLFNIENAELTIRLQNTKTKQTGKQAHLYHQFALVKNGQISLFHRLNYSLEDHRYTDKEFNKNISFYDTTYFDTKKTLSSYKTQFKVLDNQIGIKGRIADLQYRIYGKHKTYSFNSTFTQDTTIRDTTIADTIKDELFVAGGLRYFFDSLNYIDASAEYLLGSDYILKGHFKHKNISVHYIKTSHRPSLIQQRYYGGHFKWNHDQAKNTRTSHIKAAYTLGLDTLLTISPHASYTTIKNLMYYDTLALSQQDSTQITFLQVGINSHLIWKKLHLKTSFLYSKYLKNESGLSPVPELFVNASLFYNNPIKHRVLQSQIGIDVHWKNDFYGQAYMPVTQQFYQQNRYKIGDYVILDAFFNFKINKVRLFLKVNNILDRMFEQDYFETPLYMGQPRSFEFGFQWLFFD